MYREWRKDRSNKYGYYINDSDNEHTYCDGVGFVGQYPEADERAALEYSVKLLTRVLITYTVCEFITKLLFSDYPFSAPFGVTLSREAFTSNSDLRSIAASYIANIIPRTFAVLILIFRLKLSPKLFMPMKITNKSLFWCCIPVAMLTFGITYMFSELAVSMLPVHNTVLSEFRWTREITVSELPVILLFTIILPVLSEITGAFSCRYAVSSATASLCCSQVLYQR